MKMKSTVEFKNLPQPVHFEFQKLQNLVDYLCLHEPKEDVVNRLCYQILVLKGMAATMGFALPFNIYIPGTNNQTSPASIAPYKPENNTTIGKVEFPVGWNW
jgi:hypothetical protein